MLRLAKAAFGNSTGHISGYTVTNKKAEGELARHWYWSNTSVRLGKHVRTAPTYGDVNDQSVAVVLSANDSFHLLMSITAHKTQPTPDSAENTQLPTVAML